MLISGYGDHASTWHTTMPGPVIADLEAVQQLTGESGGVS